MLKLIVFSLFFIIPCFLNTFMFFTSPILCFDCLFPYIPPPYLHLPFHSIAHILQFLMTAYSAVNSLFSLFFSSFLYLNILFPCTFTYSLPRFLLSASSELHNHTILLSCSSSLFMSLFVLFHQVFIYSYHSLQFLIQVSVFTSSFHRSFTVASFLSLLVLDFPPISLSSTSINLFFLPFAFLSFSLLPSCYSLYVTAFFSLFLFHLPFYSHLSVSFSIYSSLLLYS